MAFLSVMIPVYNGEELVGDAIESVIAQPCQVSGFTIMILIKFRVKILTIIFIKWIEKKLDVLQNGQRNILSC